MSWYLANETEMIDQFASISGLKALRMASSGLTTLADFFRDGETQNVSTCIAQLAKVQGDADVKSTATGLAKLMRGQKHVFITQGFEADHDAREAGSGEPGGLRHPRHADVLAPIRAKATRVLQRYFKRQQRVVLRELKPKLRKLREAESDDKLKGLIPDKLPVTLTSGTGFDFSDALTTALRSGYDGLAGDIESDSELADDAVQVYLQDHSLSKLTGGLDDTTVQRLRSALADAYDAGADYDGLVKAVQDEYAGFSDVRAGMIAQTEMNAAYNAGRKQLGEDLGFNEKSWDPDGTACEEICLPNVDEGWIGMDEEFSSGDDGPPGHPNCDCSLDVRLNADAEE